MKPSQPSRSNHYVWHFSRSITDWNHPTRPRLRVIEWFKRSHYRRHCSGGGMSLRKSRHGPIHRFLIYLGGILGMLYTGSWYYPAIIVLAGLTSVVWDCRWLHKPANWARTSGWEFIRKRTRPRDVDTEAAIESDQSSLDLEKPLHHRLAHIDPTASRPRSTLPHSPPPRPRHQVPAAPPLTASEGTSSPLPRPLKTSP